MNRIKKIFLSVICTLLIISSAVFAADDTDILSAAAVNTATGKTAARLLKGSYSMQVGVKNNTDKEQNLLLIITKLSNGVCRKVIMGTSEKIGAFGEGKITAECDAENGIDTIKCIVVSSEDGSMFPITSAVKNFTKRGWN